MGETVARVGRFILTILVRVVIRPVWNLLGRMGLALRNLLAWLLWRPLVKVGRAMIAVVRAAWFFTGRLGLALRNLLTWFLWWPLLFVTAPLRWFYRRFLRRPLAYLSRRFISRPAAFVYAFFLARWQATAVRRARWRRRILSRWLLLRARFGLLLRRPSVPQTAVKAPHLLTGGPARSRLTRPITVLVTFSLMLLFGFMTSHGRQPDEVDADSTAVPLVERVVTATYSPPEAEGSVATAVPEILMTPWPTPDPLSGGGSVAFTLRRNGNSDIYVLSVGHLEPIRLTGHPAEDRNPAWSPDGRQIAFASNRDGSWNIYVLDLPTGDLRRITHDATFDSHPGWSPDGQWLVYESYREANMDLYIVRADGSSASIRLTQHPAADFSPVWSPDGRHIAFTSWRTGNKDIFIMSLDSASDRAAFNVTASPDRFEDHPVFSPDGRYLAYYDNSTGFDLIYAVPLDNYLPAGPPISIGQGRYPTWLPDGRGLAYIHSNESRHHLIASSLDAWSVAPQAYSSRNPLSDTAWSAVTLPPTFTGYLEQLSAVNDSPLFVEHLSEPQSDGPPYLLWRVAVNAPSPYLSDRVDESFTALRQRIITEAGWDFLGQLDNMYERLELRPPPGQSNKSWNKAGRAFDVYVRYVLSDDPQVEVVREDRGNETYWRIFLKTARQDGSQGEPLRELPWDFRARYGFEPLYYDQGGKLKEVVPAGYYLNFTALAADYGWNRVPATDNWRTYFPGIRFSHFQNRQGLTWEEAMLEIYTADEIQNLRDQP